MIARRLGHAPALDSVRGIALVFVLLAHLWIIWPSWTFHRVFAEGGFVGVELFFVLSGFLITTLLLEEQGRAGTIHIGRFYARRALRIYPALLLVLGAHVTYAIWDHYPPFGRSDWEWSTIRASVLFFMNWHTLWNPLQAGDLVPVWSVSIEAQFYLVWPLVVLGVLGLQRSTRTAVAVLATVIAAVTVWRYVLFDTEGWEAAYLRSDSHIDGLLVGSLLAIAWVRGAIPARLPSWATWAAVAAGFALFTQLKADEDFAYLGGTTLFLAISCVIVLAAAAGGEVRLGPFLRPAAWLGRWSYGIYLWHFPVLFVVTRRGTGWSDEERLAATVVITAVGVIVSRYFVELPALRLRPGRAAQAPSAAATEGPQQARHRRVAEVQAPLHPVVGPQHLRVEGDADASDPVPRSGPVVGGPDPRVRFDGEVVERE